MTQYVIHLFIQTLPREMLPVGAVADFLLLNV